MKSLLAVLMILLLYSCDKDETTNPPGDPPPDPTCEISSQKGFATDVDHSSLVPYGGGFEKTYSDNGKVQHVRLMSYDWYYRIDSFFYDISYHDNMATVTENIKRYDRPEGTYLVLVDEEESTFDVTFNDKGFATKAGTTVFTYQENRLISADSTIFIYDDNGNITEVKAGIIELNYTYDLTKSAEHQIYVCSGSWISNKYNFLEVMEWIPVEPPNLRTSQAIVQWIDFDEDGPLAAEKEIWEMLFYTDQVVEDGILKSFIQDNDNGDGLIRTISNEAKCTN